MVDNAGKRPDSRSILPIIFLMGPTASGKTDLATMLFDALDCELVSVDSAQVYRQLNIGSAKPTPEFLAAYPHHLININDITNTYSAANFCADAERLIKDIRARNKIPLLVGGTMFYFSALENGLSILPASDLACRKQIEREIAQRGMADLYAELKKNDPALAVRLRVTDTQRVIRALEIFRITGKPPSKVMAESAKNAMKEAAVKITLGCHDRSIIHQRITRRFDLMLEQGLVAEVENLLKQHHGQSPDIAQLPAMRSVGYRQVVEYLNGKYDHQTMKASAIAATRQLAKRQLTWLRNQSNMIWFDILHPRTEHAVLEFVKSKVY